MPLLLEEIGVGRCDAYFKVTPLNDRSSSKNDEILLFHIGRSGVELGGEDRLLDSTVVALRFLLQKLLFIRIVLR
jgi:hypothetical protein